MNINTKRLLFFMLLIIFALGHAYANDNVALENINKVEFRKLEARAKAQIAKEQNEEFPYSLFQNEQSFDVVVNHARLFRILPISYESITAKNRVCVLSIFSANNEFIDLIKLHYEISDGDEIVAACMGVNAVALDRREPNPLLIYLLRYRAGNSYGNAVFIADIQPHRIKPDENLTNCVSNEEDIDSVLKIRKAIKKCSAKSE